MFSILLAQANFKPLPFPHTYIQSDGSINPSSAPISRKGNVYTLTGDLNGTVLDIQRSNAVFNGAGFSIPGVGYDYAVLLTGVTNMTVTNFTINGRNVAIHLNASSYCTITGNSIIDASYGIWLTDQSNGNAISGNSMNSCYFGVFFDHSRNNVVRNNSVIGDNHTSIPLFQDMPPRILGENYAVTGDVLEDFINDVDTSNSANGKTVYYWVNRQNAEVPADAGCIILVNCRGITVKNQHLLQNKYGVLLAWTTASTIVGNSIENNAVGIYLLESSNNIIANNNIFVNHGGDSNEGHGIRIQSSSNNIISGNHVGFNHEAGICVSQSPGTNLLDNNITFNTKQGILIINKSNQFSVFRNSFSNNSGVSLRVADCTEGLIVGNSITQRKYYAIYLTGSLEGNRIYGNNFDGKKDNDTLQAYVSATSANPTWDNGTIGNYWNTYLNVYPNASEIGASGIGDTPFVINDGNIDHFPLMAPLDPFAISVPETVSSLLPMNPPQNGQNREGDNNELLSSSYLLIAVVSVVIVAVAVTAIVLTRNHRVQRTTAPNALTSMQFPVFSAISYAYQKCYCHQRQSNY
jgi:parallel beta-helix repeat protein